MNDLFIFSATRNADDAGSIAAPAGRGAPANDLAALGRHFDQCKRPHHWMFTLQYFADTFNGFVAARVVTTLAVVTVLLGLVSLVV